MSHERLAYYQRLLLRQLCLTLTLLYFSRCALSLLEGPIDWILTLILLGISSILAYFAHSTRETKAQQLQSLILTITILSGEAFLAVSGRQSYLVFTFMLPIFIVFASLMSGMVAGSIVAALSAFGLGFIFRSATATEILNPIGKHPLWDFSLAFIGAQVFMLVLISLVERYLRKSADEMLERRVDRLRSTHKFTMAETIGKAAHELNNPIAIIDSAMRLLMLRPADRATRFTTIRAMSEAQTRLESVLGSLLVFMQGDSTEELQDTRVQALLEEFLIQARIKPRDWQGKIEIQNGPLTTVVRCRPTQILHILSVLFENAVEATEGKVDAIFVRTRPSGSMTRFEIEDKGHGIPDSIREAIFAPFMTTKPLGQSTGMNLSLCRVFIEEQGGSIGFDRLEAGTRFWFELPNAS